VQEQQDVERENPQKQPRVQQERKPFSLEELQIQEMRVMLKNLEQDLKELESERSRVKAWETFRKAVLTIAYIVISCICAIVIRVLFELLIMVIRFFIDTRKAALNVIDYIDDHRQRDNGNTDQEQDIER
jgi:hypothetical protein